MATLILDRELAEELRQQRAESGADRWDEVREGTYTMTPLPNDEHQELAALLTTVLTNMVMLKGLGHVRPGVNLSDGRQDWIQNYRCLDLVAFLHGNPAKNLGTHWVGGPDFAIEIVSPDDRSYEKIPFYEKLGTRELLFVDRDPWQVELMRFDDEKLVSVGVALQDGKQLLRSAVLPLTFRLLRGSARPQIEVTHVDEQTRWIL